MALDSGFVGRPLIGRYRCRETHHHVRDLEDVCRGARGARVQLALPAVEKAMIATVWVCTLLVQPICRTIALGHVTRIRHSEPSFGEVSHEFLEGWMGTGRRSAG